MGDFILNLVSWNVSVVSIVLCVVFISTLMVIDWVNIHLVRVVVNWVVLNCMFIMRYVVSRFCYNWS